MPLVDRRPAVHLQLVAHPDDDLYFVNPDVQQAIAVGDSVTTVYLTAGEADGRNLPQDAPDRSAAPVDFAGYASARQNGIRAAYAQMATGDRRSAWSRDVTTFGGGAQAEVATLVGAPNVRLIFFNLRTRDAAAGTAPEWLSALWEGRLRSLPALIPTRSPVTIAAEYSREQLLVALTGLISELRPTVVRLLDPDPDHKTYDREKGATYSDHLTHTASAYFGLEAVRRYERMGGRPVVLESYRGYYNRHWPWNLSPKMFARKKALLDIYGGGERDCADPVGCGDYQVGDKSHTPGYGQSTTPRYPGTTSWVQRQPDGRLAAFAVLGHRVGVWNESSPGSGSWIGPEMVEGEDLVPHLCVVRGADGRLHLFGVRQVLGPTAQAHERILVTAAQAEPAGKFDPWVPLGNPADGAPDETVRKFEMGMPVAATNADGRLQVFVRNFGRGVSSRVQTGPSTWGTWIDLGGSVVQEGLAVATADDGRIELFAGTNRAVLHWRQSRPDGSFAAPVTLPVPPPAGPVTVVNEPNGRLLLILREPNTGRVLALRQKPDGSWPSRPGNLGGHGGFGPVAAAVLPGDGGRVALVQRNGQGTTSLSFQPTGKGVLTDWSASGGLFARSPAVAVDSTGRMVVATLGVDGQLWIARQKRARVGSAFGEWRTVSAEAEYR